MVLPTFVRQALSGETVTVFGTGDQTRCFGHVDDVVEGIVACVNSAKTVGEIFNLGNTEQITISALAAKIIAATGSKSSIRYVPYSQAYGEGFEDMDIESQISESPGLLWIHSEAFFGRDHQRGDSAIRQKKTEKGPVFPMWHSVFPFVILPASLLTTAATIWRCTSNGLACTSSSRPLESSTSCQIRRGFNSSGLLGRCLRISRPQTA